jgi:hypothetical protein
MNLLLETETKNHPIPKNHDLDIVSFQSPSQQTSSNPLQQVTQSHYHVKRREKTFPKYVLLMPFIMLLQTLYRSFCFLREYSFSLVPKVVQSLSVSLISNFFSVASSIIVITVFFVLLVHVLL